LAAGTDAGTSQGLHVTLANALLKNPSGVLRLAGVQNFLSIDKLCSAPFIESKSEKISQYLSEARHAFGNSMIQA
jgi:hypothetical protein